MSETALGHFCRHDPESAKPGTATIARAPKLGRSPTAHVRARKLGSRATLDDPRRTLVVLQRSKTPAA